MPRGLPPPNRYAILALFTAVLAAAVAALVWYAQSSVGATVETRILAELGRHASVTRALLEVERPHISSPAFDRVADVSGAATGVRVTIFSADEGSILGDTAFAPEGFGAAASPEIQAERTEVKEAIAKGEAQSRRYSSALDREMIYVARRFDYEAPNGKVTALVARVGLPAAEADAPALELRQTFTSAGIIFVLAAITIGLGVSAFASRRYQELFEEVAKAAGPTYTSPPPMTGGNGPVSSFGGLTHRLGEMITTLSDERGRVADVLDSLGEAVISIDTEGVINTINASAKSLFGVEDKARGRRLLELVKHPALIDLTEAGCEGRHESAEFEYERAGSTRTISGETFPRRSGGGSVIVLRDVTELRHLETIRRDFVANVSHELRTPVSIVQASAETLMTAADELPKPIRNFVEKIQRNSQRMGNLIADLLDLSRLEANRRLIDKRAVNVQQVAETVFAALEEKAERGGCQLVLEVQPNVWVLADSGALEQILTNLSENAIKYSGGGAVTIWAEKRGATVHLGVDDEGKGIAEEHRARLFERFYRVDPGRSRDQGGTGLGLAIVKHLAEAMDGRVSVTSRKPRGTRFLVELAEASPGYRPSRAPVTRPRAP